MDINSIKRKLLIKYPFFGSIVAKTKFIEETSIHIAATDGKAIYYNPTILENLSNDEQIFTFAHEVCHIAFNHIYRSEGKDEKAWNIATDSVVNALLKQDGLPLIEGVVDIPEAINYDAETMYKKLLEEAKKQQENNSNNQGSNSSNNSGESEGQDNKEQSNGSSDDNKQENDSSKDNNESEGQNNKEQGNKSSDDNKQENDSSKDNNESTEQDNKEQGNGSSSNSDESNEKDNGQSSNGNDDSDSKNEEKNEDVGHDTHSMWKKAVEEKHKEEQEEKEQKKEQQKETQSEQDAFKQNKKEREERLEQLRESLASKSHGYGTEDVDSGYRDVGDIGIAKPLIDWRYALKESIKYDVDWSFQNADIEDGVVTPHLEEQPRPETEIVLDTSGSINKELLRNFLRECKNIIQTSNVKVGCFDTRFYGFTEIKDVHDIDNLKFQGGGNTNFNVAVSAFSKRVENKIIFTDGDASNPIMPLDVIWIVFGPKRINPPGGKVIYINDEQLERLYNLEVEPKRKKTL